MLDVLFDLLNRLNKIIKTEEDKISWHCSAIFDNFSACIRLLNGIEFDL
jgi:hypothetical protein